MKKRVNVQMMCMREIPRQKKSNLLKVKPRKVLVLKPRVKPVKKQSQEAREPSQKQLIQGKKGLMDHLE